MALQHLIARKKRGLFGAIGCVVLIGLVVGGAWLVQKSQALQQGAVWDLLVASAFVLLAVLGLIIIWRGPQWQVAQVKGLSRKERFDRENEARKTLATILGGIVLLIGGFFTWRNIKLAQESLKVSQESSTTSQKALEVAQEGQITDRFTKAIEQLGATDASGKDPRPKLEVRLGGIYSLEAIANESKSFHWPIMEVLCTYVRDNAPRAQRKSTERKQGSSENNEDKTEERHPAADIQAILTVLGRRNYTYEGFDQSLDLSNTDLSGAHLSQGLSPFRRRDLFTANFNGADLSGADLNGADLSGAQLDSANLIRAKLRGANLRGANLTRADLSGADLNEAELSGANFFKADLTGADLTRANLGRIDVGWKYFGETTVHVSGADLKWSKNLTQLQIDMARGDSSAKLPEDLHMPVSWKK